MIAEGGLFDEVARIEERFDMMDIKASASFIDSCKVVKPLVTGVLASLLVEPNLTQYGIACGAVHEIKVAKHNRVLVKVPPGRGKQRILAAFIMLMHTPLGGGHTKFKVYYSHQALLDADTKHIKSMAKNSCIHIQQVVVKPDVLLDFSGGEVIVIDEADYVLIDQLMVIKDAFKNPILGLTATLPAKTSSELTLLSCKRKFAILDSFMPGCLEKERPLFDSPRHVYFLAR